MIRLGIIDFDTSHAVEFTRRFNHLDVAEDQWVEGARVVAGVPGASRVAPETIPKNAETLKRYGVALYDDPADLVGKVDAVLVVSQEGGVHRARALPFLERGIPTYVDKPFACSTADARALIEAAEVHHTPLMSSSSLRFAPEVVEARSGAAAEATGPLVGAAAFGPALLHPRNPGLFHYGIHPVEMLYALLGQGCKRVSALSTPGADAVAGVWSDDRVGTVRGLRDGAKGYGFTAFGSKSVTSTAVGSRFIYRELLKQVVRLFETRTPPFDPRETLEIVAFIEAAKRSAEADGVAVGLAV